jgi:hypothetical protein
MKKFTITGDTDHRSGVGELIDVTSGPARSHFQKIDYGSGLDGVCVVLMCQRPELNLRRRVRYSRKDKTVYMDIMLNLPTMEAASPEERMHEVAQRLWNEVPEVLSRYKIPDFDRVRFVADFREWIDGLGWK